MPGTMPLRSDIVLLPFPFSDLTSEKLRPVLVLKPSNGQGDFIAAQITARTHHRPSLPLLPADFELGGVPKPSVVRPDKVFTLNRTLVVRRVGRLKPCAMARTIQQICQELGCRE